MVIDSFVLAMFNLFQLIQIEMPKLYVLPDAHYRLGVSGFHVRDPTLILCQRGYISHNPCPTPVHSPPAFIPYKGVL